jgi:KDO2-lipid IV(A) lauroyltransferase
MFGLLLLAARCVPRSLLLAMGSAAGFAGYLLDRRHRRITMDNLEAAFTESLPLARKKQIARRCWKHFGRTLFDTLLFPRLSGELGQRLAHYEGLEHIRNAYAKGKGVILFSAHYGHWELIALMQGYLGLQLALVTRPLDNPRLERMLAEARGGSGNLIIHKRNAVSEMLKALRKGIGVGIVIDQDARHEGIFVPFFNRPASTTPTLALLALRTGASVVPVRSVPLDDGSYKITYEPELEVVRTANRKNDVLRLTEHCTAIIERWVRQQPELWLWMHRRWKTQPLSQIEPGEPGENESR